MTHEITVPNNLNEVDALVWLCAASSAAEALTRSLLHRVREERLWEPKFASWRAFVVDGLDRTEGWASKQLKIYEFYELGGDFSAKELEGVGSERLYLAARSTEDKKEAFARARTWSRDDFKDDQKDECISHEFEMFCKHCWKKQ